VVGELVVSRHDYLDGTVHCLPTRQFTNGGLIGQLQQHCLFYLQKYLKRLHIVFVFDVPRKRALEKLLKAVCDLLLLVGLGDEVELLELRVSHDDGDGDLAI
jgi:hypothetical protein